MWGWIITPVSKPSTSDKFTQTIIRVYPHILDNDLFARISSERSCQTNVSIKPFIDTRKFFSMLEYIPFQDIQENSIKTLDLPRKTTLQFGSLTHLYSSENYLYIDDDGIAEVCLDLQKRLRSTKEKTSALVDKDTQTDLMIRPHLLSSDDVAVIYNNADIQTDKQIMKNK